MVKVLKQGELPTPEDLEAGVEFEVEHHDTDNLSESDDEFNDEAYDTFKKDIVDLEGLHKPRFLGGSDVPFHILKENMKPLTEDGLVLKEVLRSGVGTIIPDKSVVMMHYDAYFEGRKEQFDSTRLRKRPFKFLLGDGNVVRGLDLGVLTMKKEEVARFVISSEYAYGPMGCPPRIPENAEILFEVEIINFHLSKDAIEFEELTTEEQKKAPFEKIVEIYHCDNQMANDLFRRRNYTAAIARYKKVVKLLEDVSVKNEEEDIKRNEYLLKLYLNLSQSYINTEAPNRAVIYANLALKLDPENAKGLYRMGCALHLLNEYERAHHFLNKARKHKPYEKSINALILKLEKRRKDHQDYERMFCMRMLGNAVNETEKEPVKLKESQEFIDAIREELQTFVEGEEKEYVFTPGYTENQLEVVKVLAKEFNLEFVSKIHCEKKINKVAKRKSSI